MGRPPLTLQLLAIRLWFRACEEIRFRPGLAGNVFRGAFGAALRRSACREPECVPAGCAHAASCPYLTLFEPPKPPGWPSGFGHPPRGLVFRAHHLDGAVVRPGDAFHVDLHLFEVSARSLACCMRSLRRIGEQGLGPGRGRAVLECAISLAEDPSPSRRLRLDPDGAPAGPVEPLVLDLSAPAATIRRAVVHFVTPTELKTARGLAETPVFPVLMARIRDRVSALRALYGAGALPIDFRDFAARAASVRLVSASLRRVHAERRSARTGQQHPLGGFVGQAEYEGELTEFLPSLRAARWTGVGRQTVWGKGAIEVAAAPDPLP